MLLWESVLTTPWQQFWYSCLSTSMAYKPKRVVSSACRKHSCYKMSSQFPWVARAGIDEGVIFTATLQLKFKPTIYILMVKSLGTNGPWLTKEKKRHPISRNTSEELFFKKSLTTENLMASCTPLATCNFRPYNGNKLPWPPHFMPCTHIQVYVADYITAPVSSKMSEQHSQTSGYMKPGCLCCLDISWSTMWMYLTMVWVPHLYQHIRGSEKSPFNFNFRVLHKHTSWKMCQNWGIAPQR